MRQAFDHQLGPVLSRQLLQRGHVLRGQIDIVTYRTQAAAEEGPDECLPGEPDPGLGDIRNELAIVDHGAQLVAINAHPVGAVFGHPGPGPGGLAAGRQPAHGDEHGLGTV